MAYIHRFNK